MYRFTVFFIINPLFAAELLADRSAIGVAKPKAQGHAITKVATKVNKAVENGPASTRTQGKIFDTFSKKKAEMLHN